MAADTPPQIRRQRQQAQQNRDYGDSKPSDYGEHTIWVPSPFDDPAPPNQRPRARSAIGSSSGSGWYDNGSDPASARLCAEDGDVPLKVNYAGYSQPVYTQPPYRFQNDPRSRSQTYAESQPREFNRAAASEPTLAVQPVDVHICPLCSLQLEDPLPALVLNCPQCQIKFCYFCNGRLGDGLPCVKRMCKVFRREFWREEDGEFNRYAVRPAKEKKTKLAKRKLQNVGYVAGVGACALASATIVAASIAAVPFTAGFSLLLMPTAIVPYEGARATLERRRRWTLQCKDKKRQSVRSQIRMSDENERQAGPARGEGPEPSNQE